MDALVSALANYGPIGLVLAWVLLRLEPRMSSMERALNRLAGAQMLTLISRPDVEGPVKEQAHLILDELKAEQALKGSSPFTL